MNILETRMNILKTRINSKFIVCALVLAMLMGAFANVKIFAAGVSVTESGSWYESAYIKWQPLQSAKGYNVYVKPANASDSAYVQIDNQLIRQYATYWRADAVGLSAGNYFVKVEAVLSNGTKVNHVSSTLEVKAHDRSGFAFSGESQYKTGSGAYKEDGTLKDGAQVIYITSETAKTVELDVIVNSSGKLQTGTGIGEILNLRQKGYDTRPLSIRFLGRVTDENMSGQLNSSGYLQVKGKSSYAEMNMTLEGIGEDATAYGWGILLRNCGNVEVRNLGIMLFPDDGISLDTGNCNIWVHNNDIFYGRAGSDADQAKGDGSADVKGASTYVTISYNHFWDSGKSSLCGMSDTAEFFVTYHHNWYDHSDSRHPRIRVASVHIYNNYFDGNSKYGVGTTKGSSAFVEANYFRNCKYPMMSSKQGTDALGDGTFSGENGGMIKAYNNIVEGASSLIYANSDAGTTRADNRSYDAYLASERNEIVPASYKTIAGGTGYNNFDTRKDMGVALSAIDSVGDVKAIVTADAGRLNGGDFTWVFDNAVDDKLYTVNTALMNKIRNYQSELISVGGNSEQVTPIPTTIPTVVPTAVPTVTPTAVPTVNPTPTPVTGGYIHNFTTDGKDSSFFTIKGNLSSSKGSVIYEGITLTQCLKMESSTNIEFTLSEPASLTLVFNSPDGVNVKIDNTEHPVRDGIVTVLLDSGVHAVTKGDVANLYYMEVK
ncbi:hypothetical protein acsn021_15790 [Anaerocolumna cellulosilytica]|uniref:Uncharacterized protein n=1 Tax=Anaerocolumna cellulosilytica TaxID=433286 RepID=A0A6S6R3R5_9FIRM|nr:pectate lyase [Anaerocolumna cellulosilytica]MBB5197201.1 pectate lyase [Anaerocolumna cellulosilytica]BCJ94010.1 hypothetical protein acsn021_15790 [Anaerocolumna cellulosilytica]